MKQILTTKKKSFQFFNEPVKKPSFFFEQLFNNLLNNSIKFSSSNQTAVINIHSRKISGPEKATFSLPVKETSYQIKIQDKGNGFKEKHVRKIFYRLHAAEYSGNGIGLALCSKVIKKHTGLIWAESTLAMALPSL
ncbi:MAG: ATP-binding protein [Parafilimonas sp.]